MNLSAHMIRKQGLKIFLPLLLLTTACEEGAPTAQSDTAPAPAAESVVSAAKPSSGFGLPSVPSASLTAPKADVSKTDTEISFEEVLPPAQTSKEPVDNATSTAIAAAAMAASKATAAVPEPAALAGLAIAAAGLIVIKRQQSA